MWPHASISNAAKLQEEAMAEKVVCWASVPDDVLTNLLRYLPLRELCSAAATCQAWHAAAQAETIWHSLLQQHYQLDPTALLVQSSQQYFKQLHTSALIYCGVTPFFTAPHGTAETRQDSSSSNSWHHKPAGRSTEPCTLWCNQAAEGGHNSTRKQLAVNEQLQLPGGFSVAAIAAGTDHMIILSACGKVIDTRINWRAAPEHPLEGLQHHSDSQAGAAGTGGNHAAVNLQYADAEQFNDLLPSPETHTLQMPRVWWPTTPTLCISSIAAGAGHVLAVTGCGGVWGWGGNSSQQLGLDIESGFVAFPMELSVMAQGAAQEASVQVTSAAAGEEHSALLTSQGRVYTAGSNRLGQCSQHQELQLVASFTQVMLAPQGTGSSSSSTSTSNLLGSAASFIACGAANTAVVTTSGRLLVCGQSSQGQCGPQMVKEPKGCCHHLVDLGPDTSWHGLSRPSAAQIAAAGGDVQRALPKVVQVCLGGATCHALTDQGEVFAWGAGSKGQLGTGGSQAVQATPAKLPWAKGITNICSSRLGHFAAALDSHHKLYTWGAGRSGQLGHGDTNKRSVGRLVKQVRHLAVLQVACGSETLLMLVCARPAQHNNSSSTSSSSASTASTLNKVQTASSAMSTSAAAPSSACAAAEQIGTRSSGGKGSNGGVDWEVDGGGRTGNMSMASAAWEDVDGSGPFYCPSPHPSSKASRRRPRTSGCAQHLVNTQCSPASLLPADSSSDGSNCMPGASDSSQAMSQASASVVNTIRQSGSIQPLPSDDPGQSTSAAAASKQRQHRGKHGRNYEIRCHQQQPQLQSSAEDKSPHDGSEKVPDQAANTASSCSLPATLMGSAVNSMAGDSEDAAGTSSAGSGSGARHGRRPHMDKGFKRLLKRVLTGFMADNRQRELNFPASLSAADRYAIHVAAEAWGLGHASHNEGSDRIIKVWKVSRTRKAVAVPSPDNSDCDAVECCV